MQIHQGSENVDAAIQHILAKNLHLGDVDFDELGGLFSNKYPIGKRATLNRIRNTCRFILSHPDYDAESGKTVYSKSRLHLDAMDKLAKHQRALESIAVAHVIGKKIPLDDLHRLKHDNPGVQAVVTRLYKDVETLRAYSNIRTAQRYMKHKLPLEMIKALKQHDAAMDAMRKEAERQGLIARIRNMTI
jgi:hypothetical protein